MTVSFYLLKRLRICLNGDLRKFVPKKLIWYNAVPHINSGVFLLYVLLMFSVVSYDWGC